MDAYPEIPNLRHLRMVQVIGKLGGVTCASRELSTSQPAVTQAVSNLEAELGTAIFERRATGTYPTPLGQQFLLRIDRFFEILDNAVRVIQPRSDTLQTRALPLVERMITGTQLRSLIVTADPGRVDEIAQRMGLSTASLYRSARTLERSLGTTVFDRSAQGPILNKTGLALNRAFRRAIREIEMGRGEIMMAAGEGCLELVVGALPMSGSFELAEAIRRFTPQCPNVKVRVVTGEYHKLLDDLSNSRIDMIFGLLQRPQWATEINEEAMFNDSYCVVTRPAHPLSHLADITPDALSGYEWVVPAAGTPRGRRIEALFDSCEKRPSFNIETSSISTCRALLLRSDMVTVMTRSEVQLDVSLGILDSLPCRYLDAIPPKGVSTRADWLPTAAHDTFLDCLRAVTSDTQHDAPHTRPQIALAS
ncbi:HTH-type transcriptional regulator CynR [Aquimixticola soesokkakensis]|uniref:HTH-type transcriptional regulator CynR n=1 Tax=Aquimixticola soesokkakensis TaxID=1519096 RepID=A0A1Y5RQE3_9RHOB|nr:LysR family transcriptional regulator [Aquimixticola soesokkakensis]SLN22937.1 HTH-type transcriptional regulator CynR [Aquimixticola soesokkakensis]